MLHYVVGFLFTPDNHVVLIRKNRPEWQKGFLNGVGGKIEPGETPRRAMIREFQEETGMKVTSWAKVLTMLGADYKLHVFKARTPHIDPAVQSLTDEPVSIHPADQIPKLPAIPNLKWIIPLLLHEPPYKAFTVKDAC